MTRERSVAGRNLLLHTKSVFYEDVVGSERFESLIYVADRMYEPPKVIQHSDGRIEVSGDSDVIVDKVIWRWKWLNLIFLILFALLVHKLLHLILARIPKGTTA